MHKYAAIAALAWWGMLTYATTVLLAAWHRRIDRDGITVCYDELLVVRQLQGCLLPIRD